MRKAIYRSETDVKYIDSAELEKYEKDGWMTYDECFGKKAKPTVKPKSKAETKTKPKPKKAK